MSVPKKPTIEISDFEYSQLAEFRYQIRQFLAFSQKAAEGNGIQPQQHQLLLAVRGAQKYTAPTIAVVAELLQIRHHSAVELVDRCIAGGLLVKSQDHQDRRKMILGITSRGQKILTELSWMHLEELRARGPKLIEALQSTVAFASRNFPDDSDEKKSSKPTSPFTFRASSDEDIKSLPRHSKTKR